MSWLANVIHGRRSKQIVEAINMLKQEVANASQAQRQWYDDELLRAKLIRQGNKAITRWNAHMFSQNFEDSIIAEILSRIGSGTRTFVEIGTETGEESNSRFLLSQGWRGLMVEGNSIHVEKGRQVFLKEIESGQLQIKRAFVTQENIQKIIDDANLGNELDFLSVDIDMNTSHIWRGIKMRPRFACIEYNGNIAPNLEFEVPYSPDAEWSKDAWYGASLKTLELIGRQKTLDLVGCDLFGINAFFVRNELTGDKFLEPFTAENHFEPLRLFQVKRRGHARP